MALVTRGGNLADSNNSKADVYTLVDSATVTSIVNADISSGAAIADSKLATITTAAKVNTSALTTSSQAAGDILYNTGTGWTRLAVGTANQQLQVNTGATAPEWATVGFGDWDSATYSAGTDYLAATDGFVLAYAQLGNGDEIVGYTDADATPDTEVAHMKNYGGAASSGAYYYQSIMFPVKKGHYWKVAGTLQWLRWLPLGS